MQRKARVKQACQVRKVAAKGDTASRSGRQKNGGKKDMRKKREKHEKRVKIENHSPFVLPAGELSMDLVAPPGAVRSTGFIRCTPVCSKF